MSEEKIRMDSKFCLLFLVIQCMYELGIKANEKNIYDSGNLFS